MDKNNKNWKSLLFYILIPVLLIVSMFIFTSQAPKEEVQYSEIVGLFRDGQVSKFELNLNRSYLQYELFSEPEVKHEYDVPSVTYFIEDISDYVDEYNKNNPDNMIEYNYIRGTDVSTFYRMIPYILMIGITVVLIAINFKKLSNSIDSEGNRAMGFGKIRTKSLVSDEKRKTTFADVAGCDEEKEELSELVDFLKDPEKYTKLGARIPKGVLLVGPPGTGKTLLARAVAGEAGAPFLSISGSDFVEMYVGVGASRVRDLFEQAKKKSPAIIFIDEIDAVGRHRGAGMGGGHDEREQTLNQLLVEMDGFGANEGVIIIAATNRPDILDPALLRPGRFDRQVTVGRPDTQGREAILKVHSKKKPLAPSVNLKEIAQGTIGFTGADLENLLNEAALLAAKRNLKAITIVEIREAMVKVMMGTEKKSRKISEKENRLTAFHESGHAIATYFLDSQDQVHEISIIPRGFAGGYTMSLPEEDKSYKSRNEMLDELVVLLGGRVAEALTMGDISTGASNDIERASQIARDMVTKYGMTAALGPICYGGDNDEVFIGRDYGHVKNYSEETAALIDEEVKRIMHNAYERTEKLLTEHMDKLKVCANELLKREKINKEQFKEIMENGFIAEDVEEEKNDDSTQANADVENQETQVVNDNAVDSEVVVEPANDNDESVVDNNEAQTNNSNETE